MKAVTDTLGVARPNVIERLKDSRAKRGLQLRDGDLALAAELRRLVDQRPTYGYRSQEAIDPSPMERPSGDGRGAGSPRC